VRFDRGDGALISGSAAAAREAAAPLVAALDARLDSIGLARGLSIRLVDGGRVSAVASRAANAPPDVRFGCVTPPGAPLDECAASKDSVLGRATYAMQLAVGRPSAEWIAWIGDVARERGTDAVLVVSLEPAQYLPRQVGLRGDKQVELGARHVVELPWLTAVDAPVAVLQLTGALVRPDGRAIRIAAEGIMVRRSSLAAGAFGLQRALTPQDLRDALSHRREELPGAPLAWQVALDELVRHLTGRTTVAYDGLE
jgi:hypothetical protein